MGQNVKNCEGSETFTYFHANNLCCPNFIDTDRRHKTSESETKYDLLAPERVVRESAFILVPQAPIHTG